MSSTSASASRFLESRRGRLITQVCPVRLVIAASRFLESRRGRHWEPSVVYPDSNRLKISGIAPWSPRELAAKDKITGPPQDFWNRAVVALWRWRRRSAHL